MTHENLGDCVGMCTCVWNSSLGEVSALWSLTWCVMCSVIYPSSVTANCKYVPPLMEKKICDSWSCVRDGYVSPYAAKSYHCHSTTYLWHSENDCMKIAEMAIGDVEGAESRGWVGTCELKTVSADGCRSLSRSKWKAARHGEERKRICSITQMLGTKTKVDNMRYYRRIHLEVIISLSSAASFLRQGGRRLWRGFMGHVHKMRRCSIKRLM